MTKYLRISPDAFGELSRYRDRLLMEGGGEGRRQANERRWHGRVNLCLSISSFSNGRVSGVIVILRFYTFHLLCALMLYSAITGQL